MEREKECQDCKYWRAICSFNPALKPTDSCEAWTLAQSVQKYCEVIKK